VRCNAYLDPVGESTGALRVEWDGDVVALETAPGDVIAFDPCARHASFGGARRLRWCVDYAAVPSEHDADRRHATKGLVEELGSWPHPPEWPVWRTWAADGTNSRRARAVATLRQLGVNLDD